MCYVCLYVHTHIFYCKYTSANTVTKRNFETLLLTETVHHIDGYNKDSDYSWTYLFNTTVLKST